MITRSRSPQGLDDDPGVTRRIIWACFMLTALSIFLYHASQLFRQYQQEEVSVSLKPNSVPFKQPDILICLNKPLTSELWTNGTEKLNKTKKVEDQVRELEIKLAGLNISKYNNFFYASKFLWNSVDLRDLYDAYFYKKNELFISVDCYVHSIDTESQTLRMEMNWKHFACWRMTIDEYRCSLNKIYKSMTLILYTHTHKVNQWKETSPKITFNEIPLDLYRMNSRYEFDVVDSVILYFLPQHENIQNDTPKVTLMGGTSTDISIKSKIFNRQNRTSFICQAVMRNFTFYDLLSPNTTQTFNDFTSCYSAAFQQSLHRRCKCVLSYLPIPITLPRNVHFCFNISIFNKSCNIHRDATWKENIHLCEEEKPCAMTEFSIQTNTMNWPLELVMPRFLKKFLPTNEKDRLELELNNPGFLTWLKYINSSKDADLRTWKQNLYKVQIHPGEYFSTEMNESIPYQFTNFLADATGVMGFYVGGSLLTLVKIYDIMYNYCYKAYLARRLDKSTVISDHYIL